MNERGVGKRHVGLWSWLGRGEIWRTRGEACGLGAELDKTCFGIGWGEIHRGGGAGILALRCLRGAGQV